MFSCRFRNNLYKAVVYANHHSRRNLENISWAKKMEDCQLKSKISERLSSLVYPTHYKLTLKPDLVSGIFTGDVKIDVVLKEERSSIALHSKFLNVNEVKVFDENSKLPQKFSQLPLLEQLVIHFDNSLCSGNYRIEIDFDGDLTRNIIGFYLSKLKNNRTMVASKFQPTYARQAFPCFDEPNFKATYDISLVKSPSDVALSNMNEIMKTHDSATNLDTVTFATSVPMSTYLACFVICDFGHKEVEIDASGIGNNFILKSFAQKDELHKIDFAQDIGKRATEFYIKYYEVPFPLPKLDMIAIPDYVSGATEHWGLITYRETSFLVDESTASSTNKINVANTIAHELAHMWFGNLVTMNWWDEVWLNEGFASYMQVKSLNAMEPSWTMLDQFLVKTLHSVLVMDAKLSSHPIVQTVETPDEITAIFDSISYNKGASVLRMLEGFTGEENFRLGVSDYLKKYQFGNTVTQQLLSSLEPYFNKNNPDINLTHVMDTWTRQMGYPLLTVKPGDEANTYVISQTRFLLDPDAVYKNDSQYKYRWFVPITYTTSKGRYDRIVWFPDTVDNVIIKVQNGVDWLKINNNQVGYYRVHYTREMWEQLIKQMNEKNQLLTISDRAHLLNEAFALAEARVLPYEVALNLTTYLAVEEDYVPWYTASSILGDLADRLVDTSAYSHLEKYIQSLVQHLYEKISWEKSDIGVIDGLLRTKILSLATRYQLADAEVRVRSMLLRWLNSHRTAEPEAVEPDLREFVYYYGMKSATQEEWDRLWEIYLKETDVQEATKLRLALSAPRDTNILRKYLVLAWDETNIRSQDYLNVVVQLSSNPAGTRIVWEHVRAHWPRLLDRFTLNSRYLGNLLPSITDSFNTETRLNEMEAFFAQYPNAGAGEAARSRALETVRNNIRWAQTHQTTVADWLIRTA